MNERGRGWSTKTRMFIDLMVKTAPFSLVHLILQKVIANCATKVLNLLMLLELEKILAISKPFWSFFYFMYLLLLNRCQISFSNV